MSVPTAPTVTTILTEAFRRCGITSPTPAQLLRAEDEWLEEIKQELDAEKRWKNLEDTAVLISVAYQQGYDIPSPLYRVMRMRFYSGDVIGAAVGGGASTITLAASQGSPILRGRKIFLTSGTGAPLVNRIISVSNDICTVQDAWTTQPIAGTTYMIANFEQIDEETVGYHVGRIVELWALDRAKNLRVQIAKRYLEEAA